MGLPSLRDPAKRFSNIILFRDFARILRSLVTITDPNFEDHAIGNTHIFFWPYQLVVNLQSMFPS
jgi:hypothetical protein